MFAVVCTRLFLRPVTLADRDELIEANRANRDFHHPWVEPCTDAAGFEAWFNRSLLGPTMRYVARETSSGAICGIVSLSEIVLGPLLSAHLGFYAMQPFAGSGLMAEAVREAVRRGFTELGLHRVEANIQPSNTRSLALVRRLGFRHEGLSTDYLFIDGAWRDCERWALLDRELGGA